MKKVLFSIVFCITGLSKIYSQCCAAGGGCPIAGGISQGVLQFHEVELNANYQYVSTTRFLNGDSPEKNFLDRYFSHYSYFRLGYGVTKKLTISVEAGNYLNKTQIGLDKGDTITTKGWGDLILFPRYELYNKAGLTKRIEISVGFGIKIPLGTPNDKMRKVEPFSGQVYYQLKPVAIRTTTGGNDFIFYGFLYRGFPLHNFRVFSSLLYVLKGWNQLGEKAGDYASIGLFASKTIFKNFGITIQAKGEWIDRMKLNNDLEQNGFYNYDPAATGSKKFLIAPQLSYSYKYFSFYVNSEFPVYQFVNKQQIASQYFVTSGISCRFFVVKPKLEENK